MATAANPVDVASSTSSTSAVSPARRTDRSRWLRAEAGVSIAEIAVQDQVDVATVERSLVRVRAEQAKYSNREVELATNRLFMRRLPQLDEVIADGLSAEMKVARDIKIERVNDLTGEVQLLDSITYDIVPDMGTRFKTIEVMQDLLKTVRPKTPMVAVDARSQTVNNTGMAVTHPGNHPISAESLIRQIQSQRGALLLGGPSTTVALDPSAMVERDYELAEELAEDGDDEAAAEYVED